MKFEQTPLPDLLKVILDVHGDERGFFVERFRADHFSEARVPGPFVQDNHSRSGPGILRGLHYQFDPPQGKLIGVIRGRIWDVAVDIRPDSPTLGKHFGVELTDTNGCLLWCPAGFAHGFCVLGDEPVDLLYKVTSYYNPRGEGGIRFDDPQLDIHWPISPDLSNLSTRDRELPSFGDYRKSPPSWQPFDTGRTET